MPHKIVACNPGKSCFDDLCGGLDGWTYDVQQQRCVGKMQIFIMVIMIHQRWYIVITS